MPWDGQRWSHLPTGIDKHLYAVWVARPNLVFVAGEQGTFLRWDGQRWSAMESGTLATLLGLWGFRSGDREFVVAVGKRGTILQWDGKSLKSMLDTSNEDRNRELLGGNPADPPPFFSVWGSGPQDLYAAGRHKLLHWNGAAWRAVNNEEEGLRYITGSSKNDIFVAGWRAALHFDGNKWQSLQPEAMQGLNALASTGPEKVVGVSAKGIVLLWTAQGWRRLSGPATLP